jgi:hypothetical protein
MNLTFSMNKFNTVVTPVTNPTNTIVDISSKNITPYNESHNILKNLPSNENRNSTFHYRDNNFSTRKNFFSSSSNTFHNIIHKYTSDCPNCDK